MKLAIPPLNTANGDLDRFAEAVKHNLDSMIGQSKRADKLLPLSTSATNAEIIKQLNALLERLQG